uniref:Sucrose-phosphate synthase 1 n=1 Tax=Arundo donax TaxID=35708 RepID=A0A0A9A447_ARUDO
MAWRMSAAAWSSARVTMFGESMETTSSVTNPSSSRRSSSLPRATSPGRTSVLCRPGSSRSRSVSPASPTSTATLDRSKPHCIDRYLSARGRDAESGITLRRVHARVYTRLHRNPRIRSDCRIESIFFTLDAPAAA